MRKVIIAALAAAGLAAPFPVGSQPLCGAREGFVAGLEQRYGERRDIEAVTATGTLLEVFVSPSGSWTILVTIPGGPACLVATGEAWQPLRIPGQGA